ncbi:MAG: peptidase [Candidatus Latescibacteria bacterium]|nr:peptidase [bacterium]MBD3425536.1 peptidase [Candidatus Latescibacterota bacterium]
MMRGILSAVIVSALVMLVSCGEQGTERRESKEGTIGKKLEMYAPVTIEVPWDLLDENQTEVVEKLYQACTIMDSLFLRQVSEENPRLLEEIRGKGDDELLKFFSINFGVWDRRDENRPFYGEMQKPEGAGYYPPDMTREEFRSYLEKNPGKKEEFESGYTVIRRDGEGGLKAIPYSVYYGQLLKRAAGYLEEAAGITGNSSLARFLRSRAAAFISNDYYRSNMDWMDIENNIVDITIGPYEVYEDRLFNYKTAFEAFLCIRDPEKSRKLEQLKSYLLKMEKNLPIPDKYKNFDRGTSSPVSVVEEIFAAGDTKAGTQTLAFNLPNDERVREAKGCKKVMLRNICEAKFEKILKPIAATLVDKDQLPMVTFDGYFTHILLHEFSHGLGPGTVQTEEGDEIDVRKALKEAYSSIEETKADVVGEYNFYYLIDEGVYRKDLRKEAAVTFLAGFFRSVRFGVDSAHGMANLIAFNYFVEKGAYLYDEKAGSWSVDFDRIEDAVASLARKVLMIQAVGSYQEANALINRYGKLSPAVERSLERLEGIPVDIVPEYRIEKEI